MTNTTSTSHLDALRVRLSHERDRFNRARSVRERETRAVWIAQIEKEIACEEKFLGTAGHEASDMSAEALFAELAL